MDSSTLFNRGSLSLRGLRGLDERARQASRLSSTGGQLDLTGGNPIMVQSPILQRPCTAKITGYAVNGSTPVLDDAGNFQYTWLEQERYIDGSGFPAWRDSTADQPRGSVSLGSGLYLNLAHEANGVVAAIGAYVVMWAGVTDVAGGTGIEHVFYLGGVPSFRGEISGTAGSPFNIISSADTLTITQDNNTIAGLTIASRSIHLADYGTYAVIWSVSVKGTDSASPPWMRGFNAVILVNATPDAVAEGAYGQFTDQISGSVPVVQNVVVDDSAALPWVLTFELLTGTNVGSGSDPTGFEINDSGILILKTG